MEERLSKNIGKGAVIEVGMGVGIQESLASIEKVDFTSPHYNLAKQIKE